MKRPALAFVLSFAACTDPNAPDPAHPRPAPYVEPSAPGVAPGPPGVAPGRGVAPGATPAAATGGNPPGSPPGSAAASPLTPAQLAEAIAKIQVATLPAGLHKVDATFGDGLVRYVGFEVDPPTPALGQRFRLTHYWKAEKPIPADWTIFVHFALPGQSGNMANGDHLPLGGHFPTSQWKPGVVFRDDQVFGVPAQFPAPGLDLYVGLYQGDLRMVLDAPAGAVPANAENRLKAGSITFGPALQAGGNPGGAGAAPGPLAGPPGLPGLGSPAAAQAPLPTYKAPRTKGAIAIDGILDEPAWKGAPGVVLVRSIDGAPTKLKTEAKLLWDDTWLYLAFTCEDPDVWSDFTQHDDKLYTQEAVELFVDADGDGQTYNELEIAPTNATFDAYFPTRRVGMDLSWESGMQSAVKVQGTLNDGKDVDQGWVAEAKIPLKSFSAVPHLPPQVGDKWRINLYRLDWSQNRTVNEGSAFSPLYMGDFHNLPRFGYLEFTK